MIPSQLAGQLTEQVAIDGWLTSSNRDVHKGMFGGLV